MKRLYTFILLLLGLFLASPPTATAASTDLTDGYYYIQNGGSSSYYDDITTPIIIENSDGSISYRSTISSIAYYLAVWHVTKQSDGTYYIQNASTGNYIQAQTTTGYSYKTGSTPHGFTISLSTTTDDVNYYNIWNESDASSSTNYLFNINNESTTLWPWHPNYPTNGANIWQFVSADVTSEATAHQVPQTSLAGVYRITSASQTGNVLTETINGTVIANPSSKSDTEYTELWRVAGGTDGCYTLQNVATGNYIQAQTSNSSQYTTASSSGNSFYIEPCYEADGTVYYTFWNSTSKGQNLNNACWDSHDVVAWWEPAASAANNSAWTMTAVTIDEDAVTAAQATYAYDVSGVVQIKAEQTWKEYDSNGKATTKSGTYYIQEVDNNALYRATSVSDDDYSTRWILTRTDWGKYTIQNVKTGNYLQKGENQGQYTTGTAAYSFDVTHIYDDSSVAYYTVNNSGQSYGLNVNHNQTGVFCWNDAAGSATSHGNQDFTFVSVTMTDDEILSARCDYWNYTTPTTGKYYQIYNPSRGTYLSVTGISSSAQLQHVDLKTTDYAKYSQYWTLTADGEGYKLTNVYTSKQFYNNGTSGASEAYGVADNGSGDTYYISRNSSFALMPYFNIKPSTSASLMPHAQADGAVVTWWASSDGNLSATEWTFIEVTPTDTEIAAAQADYNAAIAAIDNASTYNTTLQTLFSDNACTTLKSGVSDADFTTAYNALPTTLQTAVNKIKGTTDWGSYEKQFRIHTYKPYSDPVKWCDIIGNGYQFSRLEQPTGIYVNEGDLIYVMADQAAPDDATLLVEILGANAATGTQATLTAGLNVIRAAQAGNVFISYHCDTHSADTKKLADYPDITIHVEGGTLNGYFDVHTQADGTTAMTDNDWVAMQKAGLFSCTTLNMVSDHLMFSMNSELVKENTPEKMCELISVWEFIAVTENNTMGANDTYITNFSARCNNVFGMFSVQSGYMYASTYGTYYNETTLSTVVNNSAMQVAYKNPVSSSSSTAAAEASGSPGTLWGPAHENGHLRQGLINIVGDTEVSNNVFSNICLWERGYSTTRGNSVTTLLDQYNADNSRFYLDFPAGQDGSGCWDRTRMYWQLYLYYEVAGHHPNFYPELFAELRKDPMVRRSTNTTKQEVTYGYENYLKFAKMCCKVSGDNLTDFFRVYGLFGTTSKRYVDDYGTYYVTSEKASIDSAITYMSQFKSGAENIIFIEDRIKYTQAEFDGAEEGDMRMDYESSVPIGKCGNVGSFTDFDVNANVKASGYKYTIDDKGYAVIDKNASGAVGYKVYDADGNLVALYNTDTLKISSTILAGIKAGTYVIKAAQADGTCIAMPNPYKTSYGLTVYNGTKDDALTYYITSASDLPTTTASNAVIVSDETSLPSDIASAANVVSTTDGTNYTMAAAFTLTDKADFYSPVSFTAAKVTYERTSPVTYNSVCLPFATKASDFGENSVVYTVGALATDQTYIYIKAKEDEVTAGTPVLVYCPDEGAWSITKENVEIVGSPVTTTSSEPTLVGSFTNGTIGAGYYKLNSTGTAFGVTTSAGKVTAFRSYMDINSTSGTSRLAVRIGDNTTGINAVNAGDAAADAWYDLQGRRVLAPTSGVYIHNGRKVIVR